MDLHSKNVKIEVSRCKSLEYDLKLTDTETGITERKILELNIEDSKKFYFLKTNTERDKFLRNILSIGEDCPIIK